MCEVAARLTRRHSRPYLRGIRSARRAEDMTYPGFADAYGSGVTECRIDGLIAPCSMAMRMLQNGSGVELAPGERLNAPFKPKKALSDKKNRPVLKPQGPRRGRPAGTATRGQVIIMTPSGRVTDMVSYGYGRSEGFSFTQINLWESLPQDPTEHDPCAPFVPLNVPPGVDIDADIKTAEREVARLRDEAMKEAAALNEVADIGAAAAAGGASLTADMPGGSIDNWFYSMVADQKPWDYKYRDRAGAARGDSIYEDYGNFTYGATGNASGYSLEVCSAWPGGIRRMSRRGLNPRSRSPRGSASEVNTLTATSSKTRNK